MEHYMSPLFFILISSATLVFSVFTTGMFFIIYSNQKNLKNQLELIQNQNTESEKIFQSQIQTQSQQIQQFITDKIHQTELNQQKQQQEIKEFVQQSQNTHQQQFEARQLETLKMLQDTLQKGTQDNREQIRTALTDYANLLGTRLQQLTQTTDTRLNEINQLVEQRLLQGFEKTNQTFHDVMQRLTLIDAAQKKITELSSNVVSLQEILNDKRSRGAFGEVQLSALIKNAIPEGHYQFQYTLKNNKRVDCLLRLPEPTGNIAIDSKFPLENFKILIDSQFSENQRQQAEKQFKLDIKKHIQDIAEKYIIPGETSDGAILFIPAEAIFAELHAKHPDIIDYAHQARVWLASPTTMMAILTTARAVLKDAATRLQIHDIQKHLRALAEDFNRFQVRMDTLANRIKQTHSEVDQVHISARKISQRFSQIEQVELDGQKPETINQNQTDSKIHSQGLHTRFNTENAEPA